MAADPNGINYPKDQRLRNKLAEEIRKLQSAPERREAVEQAEQWPQYTEEVVKRLQAATEEEESDRCPFCKEGLLETLGCDGHEAEIDISWCPICGTSRIFNEDTKEEQIRTPEMVK